VGLAFRILPEGAHGPRHRQNEMCGPLADAVGEPCSYASRPGVVLDEVRLEQGPWLALDRSHGGEAVGARSELAPLIAIEDSRSRTGWCSRS
jgi:hypothetical protein